MTIALSHESLTLDIVRSPDALAACEAEWWELVASASGATPFHTPAWLLPWWRHLGAGALAAVTVRDGSRLRGLAVFAVTDEGAGAARRLVWAGAGGAAALSALVDDERPGDVWPLIVRGMGELLGEAGTAVLDGIPDGDPLFEWLAFLPPGWTWVRDADGVSLVARLGPGRGAAHARAKAAAAGRRLARTGSLALRGVGTGAPARESGPRDELMGALFELHEAQRRARGSEDAPMTAAMRAHHVDAAAAMERQGLLRLTGLSRAGEIVGVVYALALHGRLWIVLGGFAPTLARFSPGSIVLGQALGAASAEGLTSVAFARGQEPYKYRWGGQEHGVSRVTLARTG